MTNISENIAVLNKIREKMDMLLSRKNKVIISFDGKAASGKSTAAKILSELYDCNVIHMDDFFLPLQKRTRERLLEPGGNIDYERFKNEVVDKLFADKEFSYRVFDCGKMDFSKEVKVSPKALIIVEGAYSCHPFFGDYSDLKVFFDIDPITQESRIKKRNGKEALSRFRSIWIPMENKYFSTFSVMEKCDITITV